MNDLARVVGEIITTEAFPGELLVGDFIQRRKPWSALRLCEPPRRMGAGGSYALLGVSASLGEETIYRGHDVLLPIVRGLPMTPDLRAIVAARTARLERLPRPRRDQAPWTPGGAA